MYTRDDDGGGLNACEAASGTAPRADVFINILINHTGRLFFLSVDPL